MAPIIDVTPEVLDDLDKRKVPYTRLPDLESSQRDDANFIYVPSLNIQVARERTHPGSTWYEAHRKLQEKGNFMLSLSQYVQFLKYAKENHSEILNDETQIRDPWRAGWLDADFKKKGGVLYLNSGHIWKGDKLVPQYSEPLSKDTLMEDRTPGISLESWLASPTKQGLPSKNVKSGSLYYWHPIDDDNSVAWVGVGSGGARLDCGRDQFYTDSVLGVRAARKVE